MILVIGGYAAGKTEWVKSAMGYNDGQIADGVLDERPVLRNLQQLVARQPDKGDALLPDLLRKQVVICDEVGCGVIPLEREARDTREAVGRLCVTLAEQAEQVVRIVCGLPQIIKG